MEEQIWKEFAYDRVRLGETAEAIRARVSQPPTQELITTPEDEEDEFPEGKILFRAHRSRERNGALVKRAKSDAIRKHGRLVCQICKFDFKGRYGQLGDRYMECHHTAPISGLRPGAKTKVTDVALLCSNCHRMVHRRRPWLAMDELLNLLSPETNE